jgi:hypothetical protein
MHGRSNGRSADRTEGLRLTLQFRLKSSEMIDMGSHGRQAMPSHPWAPIVGKGHPISKDFSSPVTYLIGVRFHQS